MPNPAISNTDKSDETGITVTGIGEDQRGYVLDDVSMKGSPGQWAHRAVAVYDKWDADCIVAEVNQGGDMVEHTIHTARPGVHVIQVRATRGKHIRAEPIASLYSFGKISHVGTFTKLEDQMCLMVAGGYDGDGSPDRVCSMVWGFTELFPNLIRQESKEEEYVEPIGAHGWMY
ncbi:MAG: DNA-packaging protein [Nitrospinae bacterium]|nr:DNA-packaging protein [Nitrospinota bacterium]